MAEASRSFDLSPSVIEGWVDDAKWGMENYLRSILSPRETALNTATLRAIA